MVSVFLKKGYTYIFRMLSLVIISLLTTFAYAQTTGETTSSETTSPPPEGGQQACADMSSCLNSIVQNTYQALVRINNVPEQLKNVSATALSWISKDDTQTTKDIQSQFATLGSAINDNNQAQLAAQKQVAIDLFAQGDATAFTYPIPSNPKILAVIPNINELSYTTILGEPLIRKQNQTAQDKAAAYNYMKNAAGINLFHTPPGADWSPPKREDYFRYYNYYATTMAVQSFNGYALSNLYADNANGNVITETQKNLIAQASNSQWIAQIASEELGKVLRQLLMYESQSYVLLTQLIQIERQILTAQIMSNSLMIISNQPNEQILVPKAQGAQPTA